MSRSHENWVWYNNELVPRKSVSISPDDRGYYFGDGIYEVYRVYRGVIFEANGHYDRLKRTAEALRIPLHDTAETLNKKLNELVQKNGLDTGTIYLQITRGAAPRAHPFPAAAEPVMLAYTTEYERPLAAMRSGIAAVTSEDIRWLRCDLKTLNLLANVLAKQEALDRGAQEVVLHRSGTVTECSASNMMMVKDGILYTHPANNLILHGITRQVVLKLARQSGMTVKEEPFTTAQLAQADEAFITGTTVEITPVIKLDDAPIAEGVPGPVTRKLQEAFEAYITTTA
ncbi:D-amino-acid transaminase [Paenibacillus sp. YYML68]|uniref:D-amino-acid transaminase n=1 Tax=Paenibacillus sp. YYML68 TaxID=2909250 RepID=UPI0024906199|nr:D-amino-acid transaminase [Paenibacillus sp. YYML68]